MIDMVLVGAGLRGALAYGTAAERVGVRFVGVVDPMASRRDSFGERHGIGPERRFATVDGWLAGPPGAAAAVVATPDDQHVAPTLAALGAGLHVLVEKPMAPTPEECVALVRAADAAGRQLHVCHVLRHTAFFQAIRDMVRSGRLGRVVTVTHRENVDARHMAHSYVRGAYRRTGDSNPLLLAKACHDLDLLGWILGDEVRRVSSFGSLVHFRPETVGPEIPDRCTDGCPIESRCAFSALRAYAPETPAERPSIALLTQWFPLTDPPARGRQARLSALATSPHGRCVYRCDNDVVDHQVVAMEMASGTTATLTVHGHSHAEGRTLRIDGTEATLRAAFTEDQPEITVHPHGGGPPEAIDVSAGSSLDHGGGDGGVLAAFTAAIDPDRTDGARPVTSDARGALESHLVGWAAEAARAEGAVVDMAAFRAAVGAPGQSAD